MILNVPMEGLGLDVLKFIVGIAGVLIVIMLGIIAYFLKQRNTLIDKLCDTVSELKEKIAVMNSYITEKIPDTYKKIYELDSRADSHAKELIRIRTKIGMNGKNNDL